jgi:hypothetical protein
MAQVRKLRVSSFIVAVRRWKVRTVVWQCVTRVYRHNCRDKIWERWRAVGEDANVRLKFKLNVLAMLPEPLLNPNIIAMI